MLGAWKAATSTKDGGGISQKSFFAVAVFLSTPILEPGLAPLNFHAFSTYLAFIFTLVATTKDIFWHFKWVFSVQLATPVFIN